MRSSQRCSDKSGCDVELPLDMESPLTLDTPSHFGPELAPVVAVACRSAVKETWRELRAIDLQIDEMTEELDGEDVLQQRVREELDETKESLLDLHERLPKYTGPFELPEPNDEIESMVRRIVDLEGGR